MDSDYAQLEARVTELESLLTHMQRVVQDLNDVALEQSRTIDGLALALAHVKTLYASNSEASPAPYDPALDRPPHY